MTKETEPIQITGSRRTLVFINILISCIATSLLATALTTALPQITQDFEISVATGQWMTSGYSLAMGIIMPLTAFLITRFPTRKLYILSIVIFLIGLIFSAAAPNFYIMMIGRILQASGNGMLTSMAQVVLLTIYPPEKRGTAMGWYGLSVGAAPVLAPTLAGILIDLSSWRMIFYVSIAIMIVALILAIRAFDNVLDTKKKTFDVGSFVLSVFAFGAITLGIGNITSYGITDPITLMLLVIGAVTAVFFARRQLHQQEAFLDIRILNSRGYALSVIGSMLLYLVMMGSSILLPLYVQTICGYSATISGLVSLPGSLAMAIISPLAGKIYDKTGMRLLYIAGSMAMCLSNLGMYFIDLKTPLIIAALLNVVRSIAIGCLMMPLVTWGVAEIKPEKTAHGTALLTSLRTVAGSIGTALFTGIMTVVAGSSAASYGENAPIHGMNITFLAMAFVSFGMFLIAVIFVKDRKKELL
ncbi:multidrug efflux MFS transporter [bacterium 210820-DFI.6.37]|nr:multidrug efflux MFS transporter [bacterium 210820-DFI.6.37]